MPKGGIDDQNARCMASKERIERMCAEIQEGWSDEERRSRAGLSRVPIPFTVPIVELTEEARNALGDNS